MLITLTVTNETADKMDRFSEEMRNRKMSEPETVVPKATEAIVSAFVASNTEVSDNDEHQDMMTVYENILPTREKKKRHYDPLCERAEARFKAQDNPNYVPDECHCCRWLKDKDAFCVCRRRWIKDMKQARYNKHDVRVSKVKYERRSTSDETMFNVAAYDEIFGFDASIFETTSELMGCLNYMMAD